MTRLNRGLFSSASDEWGTPLALASKWIQSYGLTLDVCATPQNTKCLTWITKADNALQQSWRGRCWMNPPYGRQIRLWVQHAALSVLHGKAEIVVALLPARTDTEWWHSFVECRCTPKCSPEHAGLMASEIYYLRGRVHFAKPDGTSGPAPFPSAIVIWGK